MMCMYKLQEAIYNQFVSINKQDSNFTFWLIIQKKQRFNQGGNANNGYINVGIVKIGSVSNLQLVGFHFPVINQNTDQCSLFVVNRKDDKDIIKIADKANVTQDVAKDFQNYIYSEVSGINNKYLNSTVTDIKGAYDAFWGVVKSYDEQNNTNFYDLLKIDDKTFQDKLNKNQAKFAVPAAEANIGNEHVDNDNQPKPTMTIPLNQILYGPPGTGKTYNTVSMAVDILNPSLNNGTWVEKKKEFDNLKKDGRIVFTTFHQSMSYEDFIEGIKAETKNGQISYEVKPGIFKKLCEDANGHRTIPYVLIIDEINRGNVAQIFGELITLLEKDKRLGNSSEITVKTPYSQDEFGVPNNLYIIGTMNTADRSVEALDSALRRRFEFIEMMPNPDLLEKTSVDSICLKDVLTTINKRLTILKGRDYQIGHSYFMNCNDIKKIFKNNIIPLLQEYFYGNYEYIRLVLGEDFVKKNDTVKFAVSSEIDVDKASYRLLTESEWKDLNIETAIERMMLSLKNEYSQSGI